MFIHSIILGYVYIQEHFRLCLYTVTLLVMFIHSNIIGYVYTK